MNANKRSLAEEITEGFKALETMRNNEPVAWMHQNPDYPISKHQSLEYNIPLYTHPAKTLTDEEIEEVFQEIIKQPNFMMLGDTQRFARAILRKAQEK